MPINLLIIGNGFDLACNLKTKYSQYFDSLQNKSLEMKAFVDFLKRVKRHEINNVGLSEQLISVLPPDLKIISFWDVYFTFQDWLTENLNTDKTWKDIEDMLLISFNSGHAFEISTKISYSSAKSASEGTLNSYYGIKNVYRYIGIYIYQIFKSRNRELTETSFNNYLESELDKFSLNFSDYINDQVSNCKRYRKKCLALVLKIIGIDKIDNYMIDSFNYTPVDYISHRHNIHGLATNKDVVFGITCGEGKNREEIHHKWQYRFTKEYKIAKMLTKYGSSFNDYSNLRHVIVYGSSLVEQDYDYFKTIFDECNLLENEHKADITFAYSVYDKEKEEEIIDDITTKVTSLINLYGDRNEKYDLFRQLMQKKIVSIKRID